MLRGDSSRHRRSGGTKYSDTDGLGRLIIWEGGVGAISSTTTNLA